MLIVTDPTLLLLGDLDSAVSPGLEMTIDTTAKTIKINPGQGDLDAVVGGVTGQALYSALKILWRNSSTYIKFPFPQESITPEQFEFVNGWKPADDITRKAIRTAGWVERSSTGLINRTYAGIISLGSMGSTDQPYFQQSSGGSAINFQFKGAVNEAVQIFGTTANGDATAGDFDYKSYMKLFVREYQKAYSQSQLSDIGVNSMSYIVYRFPLANSADLKITETDVTVGSAVLSPWKDITITYSETDLQRNIGGTNYPFRIIVAGNNATAEQIYMKVQYLLRQATDIDAGTGTINGKTADSLLKFVGDTLVTSGGVYIDNFDPNDTNRLDFFDYNNTKRNFPFIAAGTLNFGTNATADPNAKYWLFFETGFGTSEAVIVKNSSNVDITGNVTSSSINFNFAYDSNTQNGRTVAPATDVAVRLVTSGLGVSQYTSSTGTISRKTGQSISASPALERNFAS